MALQPFIGMGLQISSGLLKRQYFIIPQKSLFLLIFFFLKDARDFVRHDCTRTEEPWPVIHSERLYRWFYGDI